MSIYEEYPLQRGQVHVRLLKIGSDPANDEIDCTFSTFDLKAAPEYQALSYEWGQETGSKLIRVNGVSTLVRSNLWDFLVRLRSRAYDGYLWCDAICIDQKNNYERNHQVQLMSQIYRKARSVLVWLGEDSENSNATLGTIRLISNCTDAAARATHLTDRASVWQGLVSLSKRRYWTRIWIVQEITAARSLQLFCGEEMIPWSVFAAACKFPPDHHSVWAFELWAPPPKTDSNKRIVRSAAGRALYHSKMYGLVRTQRRWPGFVDSFETLYERYKESGCGDSRDRIFALLGIAKAIALQRGFNVDYRKDAEETFFALVAWGGTGAIHIHSRLRFARLTAKALGLEWSDYALESDTLNEYQRSSTFSKWVHRTLKVSLPCLHLGRWLFRRFANGGVADIQPEVFRVEPVSIWLPLNPMEQANDLEFELFGFRTSSVLLACKTAQKSPMLVTARAYYQFHDQNVPQKAQHAYLQSVFEGMSIVHDGADHYRIELENLVQFMEVLLAELSYEVRELRKQVYLGTGLGKGGSGSLNKPKRNTDRNLAEVLDGLKITNPVILRKREQDECTDGSNDDEDYDSSFDADIDKLLAESEPLAKPRLPRTSIQKPRGQRSNGLGRLRGIQSETIQTLPQGLSTRQWQNANRQLGLPQSSGYNSYPGSSSAGSPVATTNVYSNTTNG